MFICLEFTILCFLFNYKNKKIHDSFADISWGKSVSLIRA